jgi:K+-sensing histidine kinase KdpD
MLQYSKIYEELGEYKKALEYKNKYIAMKDSILSGEKISEVKNLLSDYQQAENEAIIHAKEIQIKRNREFAIMFGIILILLIIVLLFAYRNIEFRKKLSDKLSDIVRERTDELNTLFYRTSHDLAGPIATLKGLVDLISNNATPSDIQNYICKIDITTNLLEIIIQRLESVSKISTLRIELKEINIEEYILKLVDEFNTPPIGTVKINISGNPRLKTDTRLIDSILRNVLENSFRFVDNRESVHEVIITIIRNKNLKISISDNGKGIEAGNTDRIFDLFYVAHDRLNGSGIGLYQAKLAVGRLNGTIQLTHSKKPTTFEIMIPKV